MADLQLELLNALLHPYDVLLKRCLIVLQLSQLLLQPSALSLLVCVVPLDFLFNTV